MRYKKGTNTHEIHIPTNAIAISSESPPQTKGDVQIYLSNDEIARSVCWPQNKPIANIVFPQPIQFNGEILPALWIMLPQREIISRLVCNIYNQFLFIATPHPMLLWITVIYNRKHEPKCLPYYLDMKTSLGQEMACLVAQKTSYRLLLFAKESPDRCSHILTSSIDPAQPQRLQQWIAMSKTFVSSADPQLSKRLLKSEYEKIKPQIIAKLAAMATNSAFHVST
ncbi:hypothetical protein [Nostoc sp. CCY0012]|uniref:hypothetical protein n=1 Tax=Nostoc sp. CCY0012 TaxID=1056123 RepID=UPI0039C60FA7